MWQPAAEFHAPSELATARSGVVEAERSEQMEQVEERSAKLEEHSGMVQEDESSQLVEERTQEQVGHIEEVREDVRTQQVDVLEAVRSAAAEVQKSVCNERLQEPVQERVQVLEQEAM